MHITITSNISIITVSIHPYYNHHIHPHYDHCCHIIITVILVLITTTTALHNCQYLLIFP
jgi:hypothetical protein